MSRLQILWVVFYIAGFILIALDIAARVLISIAGLPAVGVFGGALMLLTLSSVLNWIFKEAWAERSRQHNRPDDNQDDDTNHPQ